MAESRARLVVALADVERSVTLDLGAGGRSSRLEATAAVLAHCLELIDAAGPACVAVKPQLACFERLGFPGWLALEAVVAHAHKQGLLVIADAKRGDFPDSARAYEQAMFGGTRRRSGTAPAWAPTPSRRTRCWARDALAPFLEGAGGRARASSCSCAPPTPAPPTSSTPSWPRAARCGSGSPAWSTPPARRGRPRAWPRSEPSPARPRRSTSRACAS